MDIDADDVGTGLQSENFLDLVEARGVDFAIVSDLNHWVFPWIWESSFS